MSYFNREYTFPGLSDATPVTVSINYSTKVLTVTPVGNYFVFFTHTNGRPARYVKIGAVDFPPFTNTGGEWYFYFNQYGLPITTQIGWTDFNIVSPMYRIHWDTTLNSGAGGVTQELIEYHPNTISAADHLWKHTHGAIYVFGFDIFHNRLVTGTPNADGRNTCISLNDGTALDDNLPYTVVNSAGGLSFQQVMGDTTVATSTPNSGNGGIFDVVYKNSNGIGNRVNGTRFPFLFAVGNNPQYYNTIGTLTSVNSSEFFVVFIYSNQDPRNGRAVMAYTYPINYASLVLAQVITWYDGQNQFPDFIEDHEARPLYRLIYEYRSTYNAGCKYSALRDVVDLKRIVTTS